MRFAPDEQKNLVGRAVFLRDPMNLLDIRTGAVNQPEIRIFRRIAVQQFLRFLGTPVRANQYRYRMLRVCARRKGRQVAVRHGQNAAPPQTFIVAFVVNQMPQRCNRLSRPCLRQRLFQPVGRPLDAKAEARVCRNGNLHFITPSPYFSSISRSSAAVQVSGSIHELSNTVASGAATAGAISRSRSCRSLCRISASTSS